MTSHDDDNWWSPYCPQVPGLVCGHRRDHSHCLARVLAAIREDRRATNPS